jgi:hypothetical protein
MCENKISVQIKRLAKLQRICAKFSFRELAQIRPNGGQRLVSAINSK